MKKLIYGTLFLTLVGIGIFGCKKAESKMQQNTKLSKSPNVKSTTYIDENNVGNYHNEAVLFIFNDLSTLPDSVIAINLKSAKYISGKLNEFCTIRNIQLPQHDTLNNWFLNYEKSTVSDITSNIVFSSNQKTALNSCFSSLSIIDSDFSKANQLISLLENNLTVVQNEPLSKGRTISIAIINQLISSTKLWIIDGKINFLNQHDYYAKAKRPTNGEVLGADGKGLAISLIYGGWSSPAGWCGSMFIGAGASIGAVIDSNWWPF